MKIISRGAEAILYDVGDKIKKERISKTYRLPQIDITLRKTRARKELNNMTRLAAIGVNVPHITQDGDFGLRIDKIKGITLQKLIKTNDQNLNVLFQMLGEQIKKIHDFDIIHGDLAPTNMVINNMQPFLIDFGLSYLSKSIEDKATDIVLFLKLLRSLHTNENLISAFFKGYLPNKLFLDKIEQIKKRARYL